MESEQISLVVGDAAAHLNRRSFRRNALIIPVESSCQPAVATKPAVVAPPVLISLLDLAASHTGDKHVE